MDPIAKLEAIFNSKAEEYSVAYKAGFGEVNTPSPSAIAIWLIDFLKGTWKFDFLLYKLDSIEDDAQKGKELLSLLLDAYSDEMEDVQKEIGTTLRNTIKFLQTFAPKLDFLNEIAPDSYVRRPLQRLWQMEPIAIFQDMAVSEDAEADAFLDMLETNFTPIVPDVASTADRIRRKWFPQFKAEDEHDEMVFYETVERSITHVVATESRIAATDWIFLNLDGNGLLLGILEICRKGLECLTMFCGNYKFISGNRIFLETLIEEKD